MERLPRYRTGDERLDQQVKELVEATGDPVHADLVFEIVATAVRLARDDPDRLDLKIVNAALKEMRYAFHVFAPYREARKVAIFGSARTRPDDPYYERARSFARAMGGRDWMVLTGAGPGIMTAGLEGAGAERSFGVNIRLPFEADAAEAILDDPKLVNFRYFFTRKLTFMKESDGFALLPGGFGTLDEAFELLTLLQTGKSDPHPIVLLDVPGDSYWQTWCRFVDGELVARGHIAPEDRGFFTVTDDVDEAVDEITGFYANYHSIRFVGSRLVVRLQEAPGTEDQRALNDEFGDIVVRGRIEAIDPTPEEVSDGDHLDLARLALRFDRTHWARLRLLIDALNGRSPARPGYAP